MPRRRRVSTAGIIYHVLNRAAKRLPLFESAHDYAAFETLLFQARARVPVSVLTYCVMPNHWHLVICPQVDQSLSQFMHWLTVTHAQRWHAFRGTTGTGSVYQGRFKASPIQSDEHFLTVCRYVERNPLRANLIGKAEDWRWSGLWQRTQSPSANLDDWPVPRPKDWIARVNQPQNIMELQAVRVAIQRGAPFGEASWQQATARTLQIESSLKRRGRPVMEKDSRPLF